MRAEESAGMSESAAGTPDATRWPTAEFPLSTAQLSWWAAQQLDPTVPNTVAMYLDATGPVQVDVLRDSAAQAARELQSPHVRFRLAHGTPVQYLAPDAFTPMTYRDLTGRPDAVATALEWMERDHRTPLNLLTDRL
ncbi:MAG: hypothetical protein HOQ24_05225, partial [Mycobacteriaceae bacterium]|nr:hypothetical protein [Mycobacteriaceae bacterium]